MTDPLFPLPLICPACRAPELARSDERIRCGACGETFAFVNGFPDLIVGARFDDDPDAECLCYEECSNEHTTRAFWIPLFRRLFADRTDRPRILAVGCGTGVEVDLLQREGFEAAGIEIGNRTGAWPRREARDYLMLANGMHLPFPDDTFDAVFCGCVFPHVGVRGDSFDVQDHYRDHRLAMAREMARVVHPGGYVIASSPNRGFPVDIFHGRETGSYLPRFNPPWHRFLLSVADYRRMFQGAGCSVVSSAPSAGYWGFVRAKETLKGRLLSLPVRLAFWLTSRFAPLRGSLIDPWIVVVGHRDRREPGTGPAADTPAG